MRSTLLALLLAPLVLVGSAHAGFPGRNGLIAFVAGGRIATVHTDGTRVAYLTGGKKDERPIWTPDGRRIDFTRGTALFTMDGNGRGLRRLSRTGWTERGSLAPDGRRFADNTGSDGVEVVTIATGKSHWILADEGADDFSKCEPAWSPRGDVIAYLRGDCDAGEVALYHLSTGKSTLITTDVNGFFSTEGPLAFAPDGRLLSYERSRTVGSSSVWDLYAVDISSQKSRLLARNASQAAWSPDGRWIAFVRNLHGNEEIFKMRVDGTGVRRLTSRPGPDELPDWQSVPAPRP